MPFVKILVLGLALQAVFVLLECKRAPYQAAVDFACAYFKLDPAMANYLYIDNDPEKQKALVSNHIEKAVKDMKERGLNPSMAKSSIYHVKTVTVQKSEKEAEVYLTAFRKTAINPVFYLVAKTFDLGKTYPVEEMIRMTKVEGKWKVCGPVFELSSDS